MTTRYYAIARELNETTGDVRRLGARWKRGSPMLEIVKRVLRTPLGSYVPDPTYGVNMSILKHATANVGARWQAEVVRALDRWVKRGLIKNLTVIVTVERDRLLYSVSFEDVRLRTRERQSFADATTLSA